jgi:hypothetical protein
MIRCEPHFEWWAAQMALLAAEQRLTRAEAETRRLSEEKARLEAEERVLRSGVKLPMMSTSGHSAKNIKGWDWMKSELKNVAACICGIEEKVACPPSTQR